MTSKNEFPFLPDHNDLIRIRYEKVEAMREDGLNPYPAAFEAGDLAADLLGSAEQLMESGQSVSAMGRVMVVRAFGKAAFFHLRDRTGQVQVYIKKNVLPEEQWDVYKKFLDNGDIVGVKGVLFRTKTGEITIEARELHLLTKATRQLPEKWHGFKDVELRYRQRYVDLIANPEVADIFRTRSRIVSAMRRFLDVEGFMEVETPMMQPIYGGASARPFVTYHNTLEMELYLRIAPELYLKRLVVGGLDRVYEINRNFRNEGISTQHNPEFTMLELYAGGWNASRMMDFVEELLRETTRMALGTTRLHVGSGEGIDADMAEPFPRRRITDIVAEEIGLEVSWDMDFQALRQRLPERSQLPEDIATTDAAIMYLFEEYGERKLLSPTFVIEFPKSISPLAKSVEGRPEVADRFELFVNGMELANGYSELNDPREQYQRFAEQIERRAGGDFEAISQIDEDYVRALEYGMCPTAGLGVGIDRLTMILTGSPSIRDVILFPLLKHRSTSPGEEHEGEPVAAEDTAEP